MWTANIDTIGKNGSGVIVQVTYNSETEEIKESYNFDSPQFLEATIKNKISQLQNRDDSLQEIVVGPVIIDENPPVIIPPTKEEQARLDFLINLNKYKQYLRAIDFEIVNKIDSDFLALKSLILVQFKIEYLTLI